MRAAFKAIVGFFPVKTWLILGAIAAVVTAALWIYFAGRNDEAAAQDGREAKAGIRAGAGRETAATERAIDTGANAARLEDWNHAAEQTPDASPDHRELQRRCRQLRDAGLAVEHLAECRGSAAGS